MADKRNKPKAGEMKLKVKRYALEWSADLSGVQYVMALDEEDARNQFDSFLTEDMLGDGPIHATLLYVNEEPTPRAKQKGAK